MTRQDFLDNVTEWCELLSFCSDEECDVCEEVYDSDSRDDEVYADLEDAVNSGDYSWGEIRNLLHDIPTGWDYYRRDGSFDYAGLNDNTDFNHYKERVLAWMDEDYYWDEEDEDRDDFVAEPFDDDDFIEDDPDDGSDDDFAFEEEDFSVGDLLDMCSVTLIEIQRNTLREQMEDDMAFQNFVDANIPKILR